MSSSKGAVPLSLKARLWWGEKRYEELGLRVVRVSKSRIIKLNSELPEIEAMEFVAKHTSIPVPKVHRTYNVDGKLYIEMEYIEGDNLGDLWCSDTFSIDDKQAILNQISGYIKELRELKPQREGLVASAKYGPFLDYRIGYDPFGPLHIRDFQSLLRGAIPLENCDRVFGEGVAECHNRQYRICFSHADLHPRNVIVRNGKVVAIVDWELAGWYPEYWEYTKMYFAFPGILDWHDKLGPAVGNYKDELKAERALWSQLDEPGSRLTGKMIFPDSET